MLEQVREATGLSEGGTEVEARDRVRWATESLVGTRGGGTLEVGAPSGWGYDILGSGLADRERWRWCWVERWAAGRWEAEVTPSEIGKEAPSEVVAETPLELVGERERMVWALAVRMVVSSSGIGRGVG